MTLEDRQPFITRVNRQPFSRLTTERRWGLIALWIFALGYGALVEIRGALIHTRHTDAGVYFSAAWSIRIGSNPYLTTDQNGWHYIIPPLLAVVISPLADAPPTMHRYWLLPYSVSVGVWYVLGIFCMALAVNRLAWALLGALRISRLTSLDLNDSDPAAVDPLCPALPAKNTSRRWAWRWWVLCFWPMLLCLPSICRSVIRGQVGPLWLLLLCMMIVDSIELRNLRAGVWLAAAICLKLIPAFLILYPLWRKDGRMLAGCALGLVCGMFVIPWAAMGNGEYFAAIHQYLTSLVLPALVGGTIDPAIAHELTNPITTDGQSLMAVLMHMGNLFFQTPLSYSPPFFAKAGHLLIGSVMTGLTLQAARFGKLRDPLNDALFLGLLITVSLPFAPVCHPHYLMLMLPLVAAVLATFLGPRGQQRVTTGWVVLLVMIPLSHIITATPGFQFFRDTGLVTWTAVAFWAAGARLLWKRTHDAVEPAQPEPTAGGFAPLFLQPAV